MALHIHCVAGSRYARSTDMNVYDAMWRPSGRRGQKTRKSMCMFVCEKEGENHLGSARASVVNLVEY